MKLAPDLVCVATMLGTLHAAPLPAQICAGFPSLRDARFGVGVNAASYTYATALGVFVTAGRDWYATLGVGRTRDAEMDASTYPISLEGGRDVEWGSRRFFFCPIAALAVSLGPYNYALEQRDFRFVDAAAGLGAAAVAVQTPRLSLILTAGVRVVHATARGWYGGDSPYNAGSWTGTNDYGLATAGVGITLDRILTIRPTVTVPFGQRSQQPIDWIALPFGRDRGEISFGIAIGIAAGRLRPGGPD